MSQKTPFTESALTVTVAIISTQTWPVGFQLNELSSFGLGRACSGEGATADDTGNASRSSTLVMVFNRPIFSADVVYIDSDANISSRSSYAGRNTDADSIAPTAWVPNAYFVMPINGQFGWGAFVTSNYGLATKFNNSYIVGEYGGRIDPKTVNLNLSGTCRLSDNWSFSLGFNAVYADAKIECYSGERAAALPKVSSKVVSPKGDEWGYGWNAGTLCELDKNSRYGLTYRSEVKIDFDGDYKGGIRTQANAIPGAGTTFPWGTTNAIVPGSLTFNLPGMRELSGYNHTALQWAIHHSMAYTSWNQLRELKATGPSGQTLFYKGEDLRDSYRIALGTTYHMDKSWMFHTGITYDDSLVPASKRSISILDQDRLWLSTDTTYAFNGGTSIDTGVSYIYGRRVTVQEDNYTFDSEDKVWLFGTNFDYAF